MPVEDSWYVLVKARRKLSLQYTKNLSCKCKILDGARQTSENFLRSGGALVPYISPYFLLEDSRVVRELCQVKFLIVLSAFAPNHEESLIMITWLGVNVLS